MSFSRMLAFVKEALWRAFTTVAIFAFLWVLVVCVGDVMDAVLAAEAMVVYLVIGVFYSYGGSVNLPPGWQGEGKGDEKQGGWGAAGMFTGIFLGLCHFKKLFPRLSSHLQQRYMAHLAQQRAGTGSVPQEDPPGQHPPPPAPPPGQATPPSEPPPLSPATPQPPQIPAMERPSHPDPTVPQDTDAPALSPLSSVPKHTSPTGTSAALNPTNTTDSSAASSAAIPASPCAAHGPLPDANRRPLKSGLKAGMVEEKLQEDAGAEVESDDNLQPMKMSRGPLHKMRKTISGILKRRRKRSKGQQNKSLVPTPSAQPQQTTQSSMGDM